MVIGFYIVKAEPAVLVLNKQVENATSGAISQRAMMASLSIGMAVSRGFPRSGADRPFGSLVLIPAMVLRWSVFVTPQIFTAIAFDSGGVASTR